MVIKLQAKRLFMLFRLAKMKSVAKFEYCLVEEHFNQSKMFAFQYLRASLVYLQVVRV